MIPEYFFDIKDSYQSYFGNQYPAVNDCIKLDKQAADIQKDIDALNKKALSGAKEVRSPKKVTDFKTGLDARQNSLNYLAGLLNTKKQAFINSDCHNKIETKRQDETAGMFSENSAGAEQRIISESKNQQYAYLAIGAAVTLVALYLITKRK